MLLQISQIYYFLSFLCDQTPHNLYYTSVGIKIDNTKGADYMKLPNLKTILSLVLTIALLAGTLCGCRPAQGDSTPPTTHPSTPTWNIDGDLPPYTIPELKDRNELE